MKQIIALFFCCLTLSSVAQQMTETTKADKNITNHVRSNMVASYLEYAKQYTQCYEQEVKVIPPTHFKALELNNQQLFDVLRYFSTVHFNLCMGDSSTELVKYMAAARSFNIEKINEQDDPKFALLKTPTRYWVEEIEFEAKYLKIPATTRAKIEQIKELSEPFNIIESYYSITGEKK